MEPRDDNVRSDPAASFVDQATLALGAAEDWTRPGPHPVNLTGVAYYMP